MRGSSITQQGAHFPHKKSKSRCKERFNVISSLVKKMAPNSELSPEIALFILGNSVCVHSPYH